MALGGGDILALNLVLQAKDEASQIFQKFQSSISQLDGILKGLGDEAKAYGDALQADFAQKMADAAAQAEAAAPKFEQLAMPMDKAKSEAEQMALPIAGMGAAAEEAGAKVEEAGAGLAKAGESAALSAPKVTASGLAYSLAKQHMAAVGIAAGAVAAGIGFVAYSSVKAAASFQEATTALVTGAGESEKNIDMVRQGILQLAGDTGTATDQLTSGMYMIESAGYHGAAGLNVLKAAAEGAKVGNADLGTVADGVTTILTDFHLKASDAAAVTSQLVETVASGKMHMQDLTGALSNVLPVAAAVHDDFSDVGGAIATMTAQGMSAQQSTQDLANVFRAIQNPSQAALAQMQDFGVNVTDLQKNLGKEGLEGTLEQLSAAIAQHMGPDGMVMLNTFKQSASAAQDARQMLSTMPASLQSLAQGYLSGSVTAKQWRTDTRGLGVDQQQLAAQFASVVDKSRGFSDALASGSPTAKTFASVLGTMTGGATGLNVALMLTGKNAKTYNDNVVSIYNASITGAKNVQGWAQVQKDFNTKMAETKQTLNAVRISIGSALLPILTTAAHVFLSIITPIAHLIEQHKKLAAIVLVVVGTLAGLASALILGVMAFKKLHSTFKEVKEGLDALGVAMKANPWVLLAIAVAVVALLIIKYHKQIWHAIKPIFEAIKDFAVKAWHDIEHAAEDVAHFFIRIWDDIKHWAQDAWHYIVIAAKVAFTIIKAILLPYIIEFKVAWFLISNGVKIAFEIIKEVIKVAMAVIATLFHAAVAVIKPIIETLIAIFTVVFDIIKTIVEVAVALLILPFRIAWAIIKPIIEALIPVFTAVFNTAKAVVSTVLNAIAGFFAAVWNDAIKPVVETLADVFKDVFNAVKRIVSDVIGWVVSFFKSAWEDIRIAIYIFEAVFQLVFDRVKQIVNDVISWVSSFFRATWSVISSVVSAFGDFFSGIFDAIRNAVNTALSFIGNLWHGAVSGWENILHGIEDWFNGLPNRIMGYLNGLISDMTSLGGKMVDALINGLGDIGSKIGGVVKGALSHIPLIGSIPGLATGGIVTGPTLAVIGEAGPEAVVPLSGLNHGAGAIGPLPGATGGPNAAGGAGTVHLTYAPTVTIVAPSAEMEQKVQDLLAEHDQVLISQLNARS